MWFRREQRPAEEFSDLYALGTLLMVVDAKIDSILDALDIDDGEETDHS